MPTHFFLSIQIVRLLLLQLSEWILSQDTAETKMLPKFENSHNHAHWTHFLARTLALLVEATAAATVTDTKRGYYATIDSGFMAFVTVLVVHHNLDTKALFTNQMTHSIELFLVALHSRRDCRYAFVS